MSTNSENPYVFDEYRFTLITNQSFSDTKFSLVHRWSVTTSTSMGVLASALTIYMVLFHTPHHFKSFSRTILVSAIVDMCYAASDFLSQEQYQVVPEAMIMSIRGPASILNYKQQCVVLTFMSAWQFLAYVILPIQYDCRYRIIKKKMNPTVTQVIVYTLICITTTTLNVYFSYEGYCTYKNKERVDFGQYWYFETPIPKLIVGPASYTPALINEYYYSIGGILSFLISIMYAYRTVQILHSESSGLSAGTLNLQRQFGRTLFFQTLTPLFTICIPTIAPMFVSYFHVDTQQVPVYNYTFLPLNFFPLFNSLSVLIFVIPYRKQCLRLGRRIACTQRVGIQRESVKEGSASIQVISSTTPERMI